MGRSEKGAYSAFTHTGAFAGNDAIYSTFFRQQGITQVNDLDELVDMGVLFAAARPILREHRLERTGVIEISGGGKELTCDTAAAAGVPLPALSEDGESTLRTAMHDEYPATNPLDSGGGWADADKAEVYPAALEVFATEPDIDVVISRYTIPQTGELGALTQRIAEMEAARAAHPDRLFVVLSRPTDRWAPSWEEAVREHHIPFLQGYGRGPRALAHLAAYSRFLHGPDTREASPPVERPSGFAHPIRTLDGSTARDVLAAAGIALVATAPAGIEIVLGAQRDAKLGPAVTCGSGPVLAELFGDVVMRMAPVDVEEATAMLDELRGRRLLDGVDRSTIAKALCALSDLMLSRADIVEVEISPAVVHAGGLVGLAARVQVLDTSAAGGS
jgi:acyl-CoA synthetase (NDP forming)